ncbi:MAG: DUF423 domain-containing protein [Verrucomicrobiota bacterium]
MKQTPHTFMVLAALTGAAAVALGALGAHALKDVLAAGDYTTAWKTASTYHIIHALLLVVLARWHPFPLKRWWVFFVGVWLFSGSIYLLCLTPWKWLGPVTPIGGTVLIIGWLSLVIPSPKPNLKA